MSLQCKKLYEFDNFRLDTRKRRLQRNGQVLPLTAKALEILILLAERGGEVVSKDDLMEAIWPDSFVEEANLTQNVFLLRKAMGETAQDRNYILTVPGKGYRFGATVREVPLRIEAEADAVEIPVTIPPVTHKPSLRLRFWGLVAALVLVVSAGALSWARHRAKPVPSTRRVMLAILPFNNLTGDASEDYFSDGLTDELIGQLGRVDPEHLGLIGLTSVMHYKKLGEPLPQIGHELQVQYVLEGSVRRDSERVRIDVRLIQLKDQTDLWSRQYDRELTNLLTLQEEIAQEVANEIEPRLTHSSPASASPSALSPDAYHAYDLDLKGRYLWNKRTPEGFLQAISYFNQALAQNPDDARAYAGLADSYSMISGYHLTSAQKAIPRALEAAHKALQIDDSLAEAHTSLALISQNYNWDWPTAEKEYRRAIQLDPNYPTAHHWYAEFLAFQGRFEEALAESERARQLDPLSLIIASDNAAIFYFSRQYDQAIERFRAVLGIDPGFTRAHLIVGAYAQKRQFKEALDDIQKWQQIDKDRPEMWAWKAYAYGCAGDSAGAKRALQRLMETSRNSGVEPASMFVLAYLGLNDKDEALKWIEKSYREHTNAPTGWKVDPIYDPLRADPRFQHLLQSVVTTK